jgi:hypothetical protein
MILSVCSFKVERAIGMEKVKNLHFFIRPYLIVATLQGEPAPLTARPL